MPTMNTCPVHVAPTGPDAWMSPCTCPSHHTPPEEAGR